MSAELILLVRGPFKFRGWCEECCEGVQGGEIAINNWIYLHNENHHKDDQ